jgi:hypothetical protein
MTNYVKLLTAACVLISCFGTPLHAQRELGVRASSSGGPLMPEQAAYDVKSS